MFVLFVWIILAIVCGVAGKDRECGSFYAFGWGLICPLVGILYVAFSKKKKTMAEALIELETLYSNGIVNNKLYNDIKSDLRKGKVYNIKHYTNPQNKATYAIKVIIATLIIFFLIKALIGL